MAAYIMHTLLFCKNIAYGQVLSSCHYLKVVFVIMYVQKQSHYMQGEAAIPEHSCPAKLLSTHLRMTVKSIIGVLPDMNISSPLSLKQNSLLLTKCNTQ